MEKNYEGQTMFNYENYSKLIAVIGENVKSGANQPDEIRYVKNAVDSFVDYVSSVDQGETRIKIAYARYEGEELRDTVEALDRARKFSHEAAIANVNIINRMAAMHGVDPIYTGITEDRLAVADFCLDATVQIFQNRKK